ncbi:MAG: divalent-cation tolerance protein CutA [Gemmatimonadota bacterium]
MSAESDVFVVLLTGPDLATLRRIGRSVVAEKLAACVNVVPAVTSVYRWQGEIMEEGEGLAILKTTRSALSALEDRVRELHPYEVPEFLALPVVTGAEEYLEWVVGSVEAPVDDEQAR